MNSPKFSVVIPTKNRAALVRLAVQSVLEQTFDSWECVIVDNDDSQDTAKVAASYRDARVRRVRTGGLTMADNWEAAYRASKGDITLLLEDKSVLKPGALQELSSVWTRFSPDVVSWPQDIFNDLQDPPVVEQMKTTGEAKVVSPVSAIQLFVDRSRWEADQVLPKGMNSAISRRALEKILTSPMGRICPRFSPDYTTAFVQLNSCDVFVHVDRALTVYGSCKHSQGNRSIRMQNEEKNLQADFNGTVDDIVSRVPVKLLLVTSGLWNDFLNLRELLGGRLKEVPINWANFFIECWSDLQYSRRFGVDVKAAEAIWRKTLSEQPKDVQDKVLSATRLSTPRWKELARRLGLAKLKALFVAPTLAPMSSLPTFENALEYVRWESRIALADSPTIEIKRSVLA